MNQKYLDILDLFHKLYINIIDKLYSESYEVDKFAFPFYLLENCDITFAINDTDFFNTYKVLFIVSLKIEDLHVTKEVELSDLFNKKELQEISSGLEFKNRIKSRLGLGKTIFTYTLYDADFKGNDIYNSIYDEFLKHEILFYRESYFNLMRSKNSVLSKIQYNQRYQFSKYDIKDIISYFEAKNKDDSEQLSILFEQAMFCYESNKYLASAACIGVAIEELCVLILEECGFDEGFRHRNTSIIELGGIMRSKGIITRRTSSVINAASVIRNSVSHTSSGFVSSIQTETLIATFKNIFESYIVYKQNLTE